MAQHVSANVGNDGKPDGKTDGAIKSSSKICAGKQSRRGVGRFFEKELSFSLLGNNANGSHGNLLITQVV